MRKKHETVCARSVMIRRASRDTSSSTSLLPSRRTAFASYDCSANIFRGEGRASDARFVVSASAEGSNWVSSASQSVVQPCPYAQVLESKGGGEETKQGTADTPVNIGKAYTQRSRGPVGPKAPPQQPELLVLVLDRAENTMDASNRTAADQGGEQTLPALSVGPTEHEPLSAGDDDDDDSNSEDDDTLDSPSIPTFKLPALAPQLGTLYLPSPVFAGSFLNLLEPTLAPDPRPSRPRASSTLSRTSVHMCEREPTLAYSRPREMADRRVRRAGREEEVWQACFPDVALELGVEEPSEWGEEEWRELGTFLEQKGYRVDSHAARSGVSPRAAVFVRLELMPRLQRSIKATRISDSLPLHLKLVPIDESSYELDVLEHLSSSSVRSNASSQRIIATVPLVGLVPLSEEWTAVLTERWEPVLSVSATDFPGFAKDVAAVRSHLTLASFH